MWLSRLNWQFGLYALAVEELPGALAGQYKGKERSPPNVVLEAVTDQCL